MSCRPTPNPPDPPPPAPRPAMEASRPVRRRRWNRRTQVLLVLLSAALAAGAVLVLGRPVPPSVPPPLPGDLRLEGQGAAWRDDLGELLSTHPAGAAGAVPVLREAELPDDVVLPAGTARRSVVEYRPGGEALLKAEYEALGEVPALLEEALRLLGERGWRAARPPASQPDGATAVLVRNGRWLTLSLRREDVFVIMVVTLAAPPGGAEHP